jgi:SIR2-like protein
VEQQLEPPYELIAEGLKAGDVIPFFGAAASAICRPDGEKDWARGKAFMPFGGELAADLARFAQYPVNQSACAEAIAELEPVLKKAMPDFSPKLAEEVGTVLAKHITDAPALGLVASFTEHVQGNRKSLNRRLRDYFAIDCEPGLLQTKLAGIEATKLYITTNYDDLLEKALAPRNPHLVIDRGEQKLWVSVSGSEIRLMPDTGRDLYALDDAKTQRPSAPIVYKMHGSIDRSNAQNDSYLITDEDYVDFLGRAASNYVPPYIDGLMHGKDFLFLGYSLEDWNVRVILRKLLHHRRAVGDVRFWAIVRGRSYAQQKVWQAHNLNVYPMDLNEFAKKLAKFL